MDPINPLDRAKSEAVRLMALLPPALAGGCAPLTTNAIWNLLQEPDFRLEKWLAGMERLAPLCQSEGEWRVLGQVQAWRHGLAWVREGAMERWAGLRLELQGPALGLADPVQPDFLHDPWLRPNQSVPRWKLFSRTLGGFRGFGKQFLRPPRVVGVQGRLFAIDEDRWWAVHTDVFGGTLRRIEAPLSLKEAAPDDLKNTPWSVLLSERRIQYRDLGLSLSSPPAHVAANGHTLIFSLPNSHRIHILGRTPA